MVITGATGGIGEALMEHWPDAEVYNMRGFKEPPKSTIWINCIGISDDCLAHESEWPNLIWPIIVNLGTALDIIPKAVPYMREQGYGRIINMSSMLSNMAIPGTSAYTASKAGLNAAIKVIAVENAKHNVLINNLNLGYMDTGMTHRIPDYKKLKKKIPVGRFGDVSEIIRACQFLIDSDYITGSTIDINGGLW